MPAKGATKPIEPAVCIAASSSLATTAMKLLEAGKVKKDQYQKLIDAANTLVNVYLDWNDELKKEQGK